MCFALLNLMLSAWEELVLLFFFILVEFLIFMTKINVLLVSGPVGSLKELRNFIALCQNYLMD